MAGRGEALRYDALMEERRLRGMLEDGPPGHIHWLPRGWGPQRRARLLLVGFVLGVGFPVLVAGVTLLVTDLVLRIEVVRR